MGRDRERTAVIFLRKNEVVEIHRRAIDEFGGSQGIRDEALLDSALVAAENRRWYEEADIAVCAATYAYHLTQAHAFLDGNKRVAAAASEVFLLVNGARLEASDDEMLDLFLGIAAGTRPRDEVEAWFQTHVVVAESR